MNRIRSPHSIQYAAIIAAIASAGCLKSPEEQLGARIFDDEHLSANRNQACSSCHSLDTGGTGPNADLNLHGAVYEGSIPGRFGNRKPPAAAYAALAPRFNYADDTGFVGGNFWDGRATGWKLGNPAADQAQGPFLNPVEQALADSTELVGRVCGSEYGKLFRGVHGPRACENANEGYAAIARSVAAFEGSTAVNQFSSKYDAWRLGQAKLDDRETLGLSLFQSKAHCANCHTLDSAHEGPLFTDFTFDNLGVPKNPENPFYGMDQVLVGGQPVNPSGKAWIDPGLGGFLAALANDSAWRDLPYVTAAAKNLSADALASLATSNHGKHRVPTLRNVDKRPYPTFVKAYGHNGYFKSLKGIVHFYNTRDVLGACTGELSETDALRASCWPAPEVAENMNRSELGNLQLTNDEEEAVVAFLGTLSDGWDPGHGR